MVSNSHPHFAIQLIVTAPAALPPIHATLEREIVIQTMIVLVIWFVDFITALLGLLTWIAVKVPVSQKTMTSFAALPPIHAALERDTVTLMTSVLEILFVDQKTALLGIL